MAKKAKNAKAAGKQTPERRAAPKQAAEAPPDPATAKLTAVKLAVARQLEADRHWHLTHDVTKVMGVHYRYDEASMRGFLDAVHRILAAGTPPYTFEYDAELVATALGLAAPALAEAIDDRTE